MRVVGGTLGGRRYSPPSGISARPTTDMAREGLFNILNNLMDFAGIAALDLFSGSGSIAYELASRDAATIDCIEKEKLSADFIRDNAKLFRVADRIRIYRVDVFSFLEKVASQYDFVFADPPYAHPKLPALPQIVAEKSLLTAGGLFVLEHDDRTTFETSPYFVRAARYGDSRFSFFRHTTADPA